MRSDHAEGIHKIERRIEAAQYCASQKGRPDASAEAEALRIHAKARYAVRLRGQQAGQQAGGQRGGEIDDARSGHLLMNAAHKGQHVQGRVSPVAVYVSQQTGSGQGPGRIHVAQKRHSRSKVFKADQAHAQASLVQIVDKGLTLQQIAKACQINDDNARALPRVATGRNGGARHV